jgi:hypothetical protein
MAASNRDDFPRDVKNALALRAGHVCSFEGCGQSTAGPSAEASDAVTIIGVAAHICAAAPRGPRYDSTMTSEERSNIANGIWLCSNHAVIIDRDVVTYTPDKLRAMKCKHEERRNLALRRDTTGSGDDIIAIGGNIVAIGEFMSVDAAGWKARIKHFVVGDAAELIAYVSDFESLDIKSRYVLMNGLGQGRLLTSPPTIISNESGFDANFPIGPAWPRISAEAVGASMALGGSSDLLLDDKRGIALISGLAALPQNLQTGLSMAMGESPFYPQWGTRIAQYYRDFGGTVWLNRLIKMEVIRLASIPLDDRINNSVHTPLHCIDRVRDVQVLAYAPINQRLPIRVILDVRGVGRWEHEIPIFIHTSEQLQEVTARAVENARISRIYCT